MQTGAGPDLRMHAVCILQALENSSCGNHIVHNDGFDAGSWPNSRKTVFLPDSIRPQTGKMNQITVLQLQG